MPLSTAQRQTLLWAGVAALFAWALVALGPVLSPVAAASILGYVLAPAVRRLAAIGVPRALAVVAVMLGTAAALLAISLILAPVVTVEVNQIRDKLPALLAGIDQQLLPWLRNVLGVDVPLDLNALGRWVAAQLAAGGTDTAGALLAYAKSGSQAAVQILGLVFLVPVLLFYLLLDWDGLLERIVELVPPRWHDLVLDAAGEIDRLLGQYLRGQLLVMACLAAYYSAALAISGLRLWLPIGVLTGLLVAIPYLGFTTGLVFALVTSMLQFGPTHGIAATAIVYGLGQVIESFFLTPRLVGERIGLHPLAVILALLVFGSLFGFVGVLLALPAAAVVAVALRRVHRNWLDSGLYTRR